MPDTEWVDNIRKIVMQAVEEAEPCEFIPGTVVSAEPLSIQVDQKLFLREDQVTLTSRVKDHTETMVIPGIGTTAVTVRLGLKAGDRVAILQQKGGQHYAVIDRIG